MKQFDIIILLERYSEVQLREYLKKGERPNLVSGVSKNAEFQGNPQFTDLLSQKKIIPDVECICKEK